MWKWKKNLRSAENWTPNLWFPPRGLVKLTGLARSLKDEVAYAIKMDGEPSNLRYK